MVDRVVTRGEGTMRHEASATTLSWIPSETVTGLSKAIFGSGFTHYDEPPPDVIPDLAALRAADRFRFANDLRAYVEVDGGRIVEADYLGGGMMGATTLAVGARQATFAAVSFPDLRAPVEVTDGSARFVQTVGGHTAVPAPRRVSHPPFVAFEAPTVWTTLALTIHADGSHRVELVGASSFPRHWVYDQGRLVAKAGLADFKEWWRHSFGKRTPWGETDSPAFVTEVETALERDLASTIMRPDAQATFRTLKPGGVLTEQGQPGAEVFLLLNGVLAVEVDGEALANVGPGAVLGVHAVLEGGVRTATLRAVTKAKVAVVGADQLDRDVIAQVGSAQHRESSGAD